MMMQEQKIKKANYVKKIKCPTCDKITKEPEERYPIAVELHCNRCNHILGWLPPNLKKQRIHNFFIVYRRYKNNALWSVWSTNIVSQINSWVSTKSMGRPNTKAILIENWQEFMKKEMKKWTYSRYYYKIVNTVSGSEEDKKRIKELPEEIRRTLPFLIEPKADKGEKNEGLKKMPDRYDVGTYGDGMGNVPKEGGKRPSPYKNIHPTVKPISLMSYLITLTTREGGLVLDPFMGSGTTAIAAYILSRKFIGFEREPDYYRIAEERIRHYTNQRKL